MFRRSILGVLTIAAGVGAALAIKYLTESEKSLDEHEKDLFDGDDEVHFIHINDGDNDVTRSNEEADIPTFSKEDVTEEVPVQSNTEMQEEVREICAVYPYLEADFVADLLHKNNEFDELYPEDTLITISHAMKFTDDQSSDIFLKIADEAGYICTKVGLTITATKKLFTQSGAIISDVLNVSNQTRALGGDYLEYTIEK